MLTSQFASVVKILLAGQVMLGSVTSLTVTVKVQVVVFPLPSSAVNVTVSVVSSPVRVSFASGICVTAIVVAQLSVVAAAVKSGIEALQSASKSKVISAGQVILGEIASFNVISKVQVSVFPLPSSAVKLIVCVKL